MVGFQIPTSHLLLVVKGKYPFFDFFTWVVGSTNKSSSRAADFLPLAPEDFGADFGAALGVALGAGSLALLAGPMKRKNTQVSNPYFYYVLSSVVFSLSTTLSTKKNSVKYCYDLNPQPTSGNMETRNMKTRSGSQTSNENSPDFGSWLEFCSIQILDRDSSWPG